MSQLIITDIEDLENILGSAKFNELIKRACEETAGSYSKDENGFYKYEVYWDYRDENPFDGERLAQIVSDWERIPSSEVEREKIVQDLELSVSRFKELHYSDASQEIKNLKHLISIAKWSKYKEDYNNDICTYAVESMEEKAGEEGWFEDCINDYWDSVYGAFVDGAVKELCLSEKMDSVDIVLDSFDVVERAQEFSYVDMGLQDKFDSSVVCCDVYFGKDDEWNAEFTSINGLKDMVYGETSEGYSVSGFRDLKEGEEWPEDSFETFVVKNNAAVYLIQQQGYTLEDVFLDPEKHSPFLDSIREEFSNSFAASARLSACLRLSAEEYLKFAQQTETGNLSIDSSDVGTRERFTMGFYDMWSGGGSLLGIELEKPFVFPSELVASVYTAGSYDSYSYGIQSCYGTDDSIYSDVLSHWEGEPLASIKDPDVNLFSQNLISFEKELVGDKVDLEEDVVETLKTLTSSEQADVADYMQGIIAKRSEEVEQSGVNRIAGESSQER